MLTAELTMTSSSVTSTCKLETNVWNPCSGLETVSINDNDDDDAAICVFWTH